MVKKYTNFLQFLLFFVLLAFIPAKINAQCAGANAKFQVCDIPDPSSQNISLFSKLLGTPIAGGTWSDDDDSGGLDSVTGVLNAQLIQQSGIYHYTYTVAGCTNNSATVEVTVGGYSGVTSPKMTVCSSVEYFNLFQAFSGVDLGPQSNGQWHNDTTNKDVPALFYVKEITGNFQFTYTMPAIGTCTAKSSTAIISVVRAPQSGKASNLYVCASDGFSNYTNLDLNDLLAGEDAGGIWRENKVTGELTSSADHNINVENIYNRYGAGDIFYTYRVLSSNPSCSNQETTVLIRLEEKLDFTGAKVEVSPNVLCETDIPTAVYSVRITKGPQPIPNTSYYVTFNVSGPNAGTETIMANFIGGVLVFPISSNYFQNVGNFKVNITNIVQVNSSRACRNIINNLSGDVDIFAIPDLTDAKIEKVIACQNDDVSVVVTNAVKLADGDYKVLYNIEGVSTAFGQSATLTFTGGKATFTVPAILNAKSGNSTVTIVNITHVISGCTNTANLKGEIQTNPLPNATTLRIQIKDVCFGDPVPVTVSGLGTLTDVTLSYILSNANISTEQTQVLTTSNGNATFTIPATLLLNTGTTRATVTNLKNNITGCGVPVTNLFVDFKLNPIPAAPVVFDQPFCKADLATIANLQPNGAQYKWYISETATTPLASTYVLKSEDYYVRVTSVNCTSEPSKVTVTINDTPAPELNSDGANFCGLNAPTILDLSNRTNSPLTVVWYDAPNNGNLLQQATPLVDKKKYYGFDFSSSNDCYSYDSIEAVVSLTDCDGVPNTFFIPDGFSPNGDGVNDVFIIPDIDFLFPDYTLEIFNRYGNGMYRGGKDKPGWDGINYETKGISSGVAPNGVYFYIIHFNKGNKPPVQGRLYLNR